MRHRFCHRGALFLLASVLLVKSQTAQARAAAKETNVATWIPETAAVVAVLHPQAMRALARKTTRISALANAANITAIAALSTLGFHPFAPRSWGLVGLDANAPLVVALGASAGNGTAWRQRIIARVGDPKNLDQLFAGIAIKARLAAQNNNWNDLAQLVTSATEGQDSPEPEIETIAQHLRQANASFVARVPQLNAVVIGYHTPPWVIVDLLQPARGPIQWTNARDLIAAPGRAEPGTRELLQSSAARLVAKVSQANLIDAVIRAGIQRSRSLRERLCAPLHDLKETALGDVLVAVSPGHRELHLEVDFTIRSAQIAAILASAQQPALQTSPSSVVAAHLTAGHLAAMRSLTRPALFANPWETAPQALARCHPQAPLLLVNAWPELWGAYLDDLAALSPQGATFLDSLGNISLVATRVTRDIRAWTGAVEISLAPKATPIASAWLDAIFGSRRALSRSATQWGQGPLRAYRILTGERHSFGFAGAIPSVASGRMSRSRTGIAWAVRATRGTHETDALLVLRANISRLRNVAFFPEQFASWLQPFRALKVQIRVLQSSINVTASLELE